jgi:hypothetical protein
MDTRIEDLEPLLDGLTQVAIEHTRPKLSTESSWINATPIERSQLLDTELFFQPSQWSDAWTRGSDAIKNGKVLVVAAYPGVGAIDSIGKSASEYRDMMSRLVITITEDMWLGKSSRLTADVELVRLHHPPEPKELVKRYLGAAEPRLVSLVEVDSFVGHLEGMNAVQATQMVDKVQQIASDVQPSDGEEYASLVQQRVLEALDDHLTELNQLFGDADDNVSSSEMPYDRGQEREPILGLRDRCLLIALAFQGVRRLSGLQQDSQSLVDTLLGKSTATAVRPSEILTGAGVRGRVSRIKAVIGHSETVAFRQASFRDAAVRYVWNNYPPIRRSVAEWLLNLSGFIAYGAIMPLFNVSSQLEELGRKIDRSPFTDILTKIRMVSAQSMTASSRSYIAENGN